MRPRSLRITAAFSDLASGGFDAGVRIGELVEKDMIAVRLGEPLKTAVLASPTYLEQHGQPDSPAADLARHRCVAYRFSSTRTIAPWEFIVDGAEIMFTPDPSASFNTMTMAVLAAVQGIGITYTTRSLADDHLRCGALVSLLEGHCPSYEPFHIYYSSRRLVPPKLGAFVDYIRAALRAHAQSSQIPVL